MKKKLGLIISLLLSLVLVGCPPVPSKYTLEVAGGSYVQQTNVGQPETSMGTNIVVKLRTLQGKLPITNGQVTFMGPKTWNNGQPIFFSYPAGSSWVSAPQAKIPLVVGQYVVRLVIDGEQLESNFQIIDSNNRLPLTTGTTAYVNENNFQKVRVNWLPVMGAIGYYARVLDASINQVVSSTIYTLGNTVEIPVDVLNPSRAYFVVVVATTLNTVVDNPAIPTVSNSSDSLIALDIALGTRSKIIPMKNLNQREVYTLKKP